MSKKKQKKSPSKRLTSSLRDHQQKGKRLEPPFIANFGDTLHLTSWVQDLLPEYLWIAALFDMYPFDEAMSFYARTLDLLDPFNADKEHVLLGTVSSFGLVPETSHQAARNALQPVARKAIVEPAGRLFTLYPECPAAWLTEGDPWISGSEHLDETLGQLKRLITRLMPRDDHEVAKIRGIILNRLFKHNRITLSSNLPPELIEGIEHYPNTPHRDRVDAWTRMTTMIVLQYQPGYGKWAQYFWRQNYKISLCTPESRKGLASEQEGADTRLTHQVAAGIECWRAVKQDLETISLQIDRDLFNPDRDDVLLGLLGRQARFLSYLLQYDQLWLETVGILLLRCMIDCLITLTWLAQKGTAEDFRKFKEYSLGKEKLFKLHLEDKLDAGPSNDLAEAHRQAENTIASEINEEFLSIDLGHWMQSDARKMAYDVGLIDEYRFLYAPLSTSAHGEWLSLKRDVLIRCANPLHRGHYMLDLSAPSVWTGFPVQAAHLFEKTYSAWAGVYKQSSSISALERYIRVVAEDFQPSQTE